MFMAKASRDQVSPKRQKALDKNALSSENIVYAKLIKMANTQQDDLESLEKTLRKSEGLLVEEMEKNQCWQKSMLLFYQHSRIYPYVMILSQLIMRSCHTRSHLKRNQELESLKESYDDLKKENASLFTEQTETFPDGFVPPCLKCLEHSNADSTTETSAATERNATVVIVETNPSSEEYVAISDENARLKNLLETGMLKSLKGHQTLCDVLKKSILHKNPRKEGLGFERKTSMLMALTGPRTIS